MTRPTLCVRRNKRIWARRCATESTVRTRYVRRFRRRGCWAVRRAVPRHTEPPLPYAGEVQGSRLLPAPEPGPPPDVLGRRSRRDRRGARFVVSAPARAWRAGSSHRGYPVQANSSLASRSCSAPSLPGCRLADESRCLTALPSRPSVHLRYARCRHSLCSWTLPPQL